MLIWFYTPSLRGWRVPVVLGVRALAVGTLVGAFVVAAGIAIRTGLTVGLAAGLATATLESGRRWIHRRRRRRESLAEQAQARRETALRRFWQASADFEAGAWARRDLEALRLLSANLDPTEPLGARLADRWRSVVSGVLGGVVDRLSDVAGCARDGELDDARIRQIRSAERALVRHLEGLALREGEAASVDGEGLNRAAGLALDAIEALRGAVRPRIAADLAPIMGWLARSRFATLMDLGGLELEFEGEDQASRVAVRPFDLTECISNLLELILRRGQVKGALQVRGTPEEAQYRLHVSWQVRDRWHLEPATLLETMRPLASYGVRLAVEEDLENARISIESWLPRVGVPAGCGGAAETSIPLSQ